MQLSCLQENLNRALSVTGPFATRRSPLPALSCTLLKTESGMLHVVNTDATHQAVVPTGAMIEAEGSVLVPYDLLSATVKALPHSRVDLTLDGASNTTLTIRCEGAITEINGLPESDLPRINPVTDDTATVTASVSATVLQEAVRRTSFCISESNSRPALNGLHLALNADGTFNASAADGIRLARYDGDLIDAPDADANTLIPHNTVSELARILRGRSEPVQIRLDPDRNVATFKMDQVEVTCLPIVAQFPNLETFIDLPYAAKATLDPNQLKGAVQTARIFAPEGNNEVRLELERNNAAPEDPPTPDPDLNYAEFTMPQVTGPAQCRLSAGSDELGDNRNHIAAELAGLPKARCGVNAEYLQDMANHLAPHRLDLHFQHQGSPITVRMEGQENYVHVVMPLAVNWP